MVGVVSPVVGRWGHLFELQACLQKVLQNTEVGAMIAAFGCGVGKDNFNIEKLRYHKIIIMTDADVDGSHIRTLLLTFFFRYMPELIEQGHLYVAQPPLYQLRYKKKIEYAYTELDRERIMKSFKADHDKIKIQRYKGLGEMNPEQLWDTTMDPSKRTLLLVTIEDMAAADRTFDMLMGVKVPPRRRFIQTHAREVRNLDV